MNKTVSQSEVKGFNLVIRTVATGKLLDTLRVETSSTSLPPWNYTTGKVTFTYSGDEHSYLRSQLFIGQYYKLQLAYIGADGVIGYYSSVGIIKYTTEPDVGIDGLDFSVVNMNKTEYVGIYSQSRLSENEPRDVSEKVYSYRFDIYDADNNIYDTSGDQVHNSFEDASADSSRDVYILSKDLEVNKNYYIQYSIVTSNDAEFHSPRYRIMSKETVDPEIDAQIVAEVNNENGYVNVSLLGSADSSGTEFAATGAFALKRGCSKDGYTIWNTILTFRLNGQQPSRWLWRDMTVEHGYSYKYALQQFNDAGLYSNKIYSNEVYVSFEDMFLFDGQRQLKLKYNPKVTSFKSTVLETKTNTIGSQFPFIFRNGKVNYKEFPISALVSYWSDNEELFISSDELFLNEKTTNLTDENLTAERIFKLKVLEFFNDGKPKLFRSPVEGNYIVRLLNTSMTPTDSVGRMLHTISSTASEVAEFNYESLLDYDFIELQDTQYTITRWETIELARVDDYGNLKPWVSGEEMLNYAPATSIVFDDVLPGTKFQLITSTNEIIDVVIGTTGHYELSFDIGLEIMSVRPLLNSSSQDIEYNTTGSMSQGSLTYSYESSATNVFDTLEEVNIHDYPLKQLVGYHDVISELEERIHTTYTNIADESEVEFIIDKITLLNFTYLRFNKRPVYTLYTKNRQTYYWDVECSRIASTSSLEDSYIYEVFIVPEIIENMPLTNSYYVSGDNPRVELKNYGNSFYIDGNRIDLTETEYYELVKPENITSLIMEDGLILDCAYQTKEFVYSLESTNAAVKEAKDNYESALSNLRTLLDWETVGNYYQYNTGYTNAYFSALDNAFETLNATDENGQTLYDIYLNRLAQAVAAQREANQFYEQ